MNKEESWVAVACALSLATHGNTHCNIRCNRLQRTATHYNPRQVGSQGTLVLATHRNTHCNKVQHITAHSSPHEVSCYQTNPHHSCAADCKQRRLPHQEVKPLMSPPRKVNKITVSLHSSLFLLLFPLPHFLLPFSFDPCTFNSSSNLQCSSRPL